MSDGYESNNALDEACAAIGRDPNPAYVKDSELRYVAVNDAYAALWDISPAALVGQQSHQHFEASEHADRDEKERRSLVFGKEQVALFTHPLNNQCYRILIERLRDPDGKPFVCGHFEPVSGARHDDTSVQAGTRSRPAQVSVQADDPDAAAGNDHLLLKSAIEQAGIPMAVEDDRGRLVAASASYLGYRGTFTETDLPLGGRLLKGKASAEEGDGKPATLASVARAVEGVNARLHEALDKIDVGIVLYGPDDKYIYANPALLKLIGDTYEMKPGMSRREILQAAWESQNIPEDRDEWVKSRMGSHHAYGEVFIDKLGNGRWLRMVNQKLADGSTLGLRLDVTELVEREQALTRKETENGLYRAVLEELPIPSFIKDEDSKFVFVNRAFAEFAKTPAETLIGDDGAKVLAKPREPVMETDIEVLETGEPMELEVHIPDDEGRELTYLTRKARFTAVSGEKYLLCSTVNVTNMKDRENELRLARETAESAAGMLGLATGAMVQGMVIVVDGKVSFTNAKFRELLDVPGEVVKPGLEYRDFVQYCADRGDFDSMGREATTKMIIEAAEDRRSYETERCLPNGTWVKIHSQATENNTLVITYTDITDAKNREARLGELLVKAEAADRAKSEFLANMSHEIRTPMNGVLGMAELLARTQLDSRQKTFTDIIAKSGNALLTIINDILDFSKIDAGQLVLENAPFDLRETVEDVAALVSARAMEKDVELIVRADPVLDARVAGDVGRMRQVLTNIVGNAVKFTESGHVLVELDGKPVSADRLALTIRVEDTGIGIPEDKLDTVFEKFSQVDASSTRRHEGTGLGLAITARLLDMMGGSISVESTHGEGSVFTVRLEMSRDTDYVPVDRPQIDIKGARILVIDDNAVNREILTEQLAAWGLDGCAASSGDEGEHVLEVARRFGMHVDALILDYQMPERNGAEVARSIRAKYPADELPILMLTSMDIRSAEPDFAALDVQATLMKPARSALLLETLVDAIRTGASSGKFSVTAKADGAAAEMTGELSALVEIEAPSLVPEDDFVGEVDQPRPEEAAPASPQDWLDEMNAGQGAEDEIEAPLRKIVAKPSSGNGTVDILVAEDNEVNQIVFTQILEQMGANYLLVSDGAQAVAAWREHRPSIVLMDVSMPVMNGYRATGTIREIEQADRSLGHTPIIGVTAHALPGDRERCIDAGMDDYLSKPISPEKLDTKVRQWLPLAISERLISEG
ncbi:response regulator [Pseudohoeflea suaedae]|uniref:Sensory/regulatory protein RpfC n=1 Tax=Pseudohoeflea suaedae TaxID=877384 RepID=A0A4R5PPQ6_9HYPH|nr:response regulator [Pseudohoeflea suaedae]TDH38597.1 response regulator [Pseudohoeflea suaedae]